ncbi:hypothetical protein MY11210_005211 [Beauveria gryllotalpidicola]
MGIPHLISTLEPYVQHVALKDVDVVVDGPGLAHHILHVCRINGVDHPSYQLLGATAAAWLDSLAAQDTVIKMIYFDGYLPKSKLPVRMQRAVRITSQLSSFRGYNVRGCPRCHVTELVATASVDAFKNGRPETKPLEAPSFLVPAVIEALWRSRRYKSIVKIIPGEADGYCAKAAAEVGGIVITSDSDLLVHDLGAGGVALLRDIYRGDDGVVRAAVYRPREIFRTLGLSDPSDICRFAYERSCSAHTTTAMLVRACSEPVKDEKGYKEFCAQYREEERAVIPRLNSGDSLALEGLDPRWSELLLQISQSGTTDAFRMFLPVLIDSSEKGTAWENSMYIRQLAYSLARNMLPGISGSVYEFRRVQTREQSGREVVLLCQYFIHSKVIDLADTFNQLAGLLAKEEDALYWLLAYMILDIRGSLADGRTPFAVYMLQLAKWPDENARIIHWSFVHLVAQLQAAYYSLRMLRQLIHAGMADAKAVAGPSFAKLAHALDKLPLLEDSPDVRSVSKLLNAAPAARNREILAHFVELPGPQIEDKWPSKQHKKRKHDSAVSKNPAKSAAAANWFGLLPLE